MVAEKIDLQNTFLVVKDEESAARLYIDKEKGFSHDNTPVRAAILFCKDSHTGTDGILWDNILKIQNPVFDLL